MYSNQHRLAFVHIPKTAGTSIELFFTGYDWIAQNSEDYAAFCAGEKLWAKDRNYFPKHARIKHATQAELAAQLGPASWNASFRFTIVRNPWARLLSVYNHSLRDGPKSTPRPFAAWLGQRDPLDHLGLPVFRDWISNWSDFNFIARFERLESDFVRLLRMLGLPPAGLPMANHGSSGKHDPADYDEQARQIIADRCGAEIERFKYRFEDTFPPTAPSRARPPARAPWKPNFNVVPASGAFTIRHPALFQ